MSKFCIVLPSKAAKERMASLRRDSCFSTLKRPKKVLDNDMMAVSVDDPGLH